MTENKMKIINILDENYIKIISSMFPEDTASRILCNENNIDYEEAKKMFLEYAKENDILVNMRNF